MKTPSHLTQTIRHKGLRATPARVSLLAIFELENKPLSAKDLEDHSMLRNMDQATIYRNIQSLKEVGLIRQLDFQERFSFYEIATKGDHHHLVCVQCGAIEELDNCPAQEMSQAILSSSKQFSSILHHSLEFYGVCQACSKAKA